MKTGCSIGLLAAAAIIVLALSSAAVAGGDTPQIKHREGVGNYLTDGKGMTLYYITKDRGPRNAWSGPCLEKWPVHYSEQIKAPAGSNARDFGDFTRSNGTKQSTFKGWPLYYFARDKAPGDTNGECVKDVWFVINPISIPSCF